VFGQTHTHWFAHVRVIIATSTRQYICVCARNLANAMVASFVLSSSPDSRSRICMPESDFFGHHTLTGVIALINRTLKSPQDNAASALPADEVWLGRAGCAYEEALQIRCRERWSSAPYWALL
jgi:hypothetical protein